MSHASTGQGPKIERPLSPHLQVYRPQINMVMSIIHRMTGAGLYFGTLLLAFWLVSVASGPEAYASAASLLGTWVGRIILVGFSWALVHHALGGIRHFVWDLGIGYGLGTIDAMSWGTIILSVLITAALWAFVLASQGGL